MRPHSYKKHQDVRVVAVATEHCRECSITISTATPQHPGSMPLSICCAKFLVVHPSVCRCSSALTCSYREKLPLPRTCFNCLCACCEFPSFISYLVSCCRISSLTSSSMSFDSSSSISILSSFALPSNPPSTSVLLSSTSSFSCRLSVRSLCLSACHGCQYEVRFRLRYEAVADEVCAVWQSSFSNLHALWPCNNGISSHSGLSARGSIESVVFGIDGGSQNVGKAELGTHGPSRHEA